MIKKIILAAILMAMPAQAGIMYVNSDDGLRVRKEADINSEVLTVLPFASPVTVTGLKSEDWQQIKFEDGNAFVHADFIQDTNPLEEMTELGTWRVTAYAYTGSACANGQFPTTGYTIACNSLPFGTEVYIEGVGFRIVEDRGPASMGNDWCDLYLGSYDACVQWGDQRKRVWRVK